MTTVLLIEDDADMRLLVRLVLRPNTDLELVAEAERAEDALVLDLELEPDVIVLDHHLAGGRFGLEAAPDLKARWPEASIVLFSAADLRREVLQSPAIDGYVRKDDIRALVGAVRHVSGRTPVAEYG